MFTSDLNQYFNFFKIRKASIEIISILAFIWIWKLVKKRPSWKQDRRIKTKRKTNFKQVFLYM